MKKRILALSLVACVCAGLLCGCGDTTSNQPANSNGNTTSSEDAEESDVVMSERQANNEIIVGIPQDLDDSLDPNSLTAAGTREVMFNVYEGLVKIAPDGSVFPAVASDVKISDDGTTYTFVLRDGVKFHNGETVTTDDVVYSIETCAANTVLGAVQAALSAITDISVDGNSVIVTLAEPNADFLVNMTNAFIAPKDYADGATNPIGTGPFKFVSRSVMENVVFEKNTDYYGTPASLDKVTFKVFSGSEAELQALDAGAIDLAGHLQADQVATLSNGYDVLENTMNLAVALYLNNANPILSDARVRQALCYAVNVDEIMAFATGGYGTKIGSSMFPNFKKYFDPALAENYATDVQKAKDLLAEAGYPDGFELKLTYASEYEHPYGDMAMTIQQQLQAIGVKVTLDPIQWSSWLSDVYAGRNFESTIVGFDASVLTANAMLQRWTSTAGDNMISFSNAEYDEKFAQAQVTTDDEEQTKLFKECLEILNREAANVYLIDNPSFVVINPALTGYEFYPLYIQDMAKVSYK